MKKSLLILGLLFITSIAIFAETKESVKSDDKITTGSAIVKSEKKTVKAEETATKKNEKSADIKKREEKFKKSYSDNKKNSKIAVKFGEESYYMGWSGYHESGMASFEFLRKGEKVENYKRLITVISLPKEININSYMKNYIAALKPYLVNQPTGVKNKKSKYKGDMVADLILANEKEDIMEYTLARVYENSNNEGMVIIYSARFKLSAMKASKDMFKKEIDDKAATWVKNLFNVEFQPFVN